MPVVLRARSCFNSLSNNVCWRLALHLIAMNDQQECGRKYLMDEKKETTRIEAFSDGVFAIAITLLVLELKPAIDHVLESHPEVGLFGAMGEQWPIFLAFVISFATLGIMWLNHHRLFNLIIRIDHTLLVLNLFVLFAATVVPFPTA